MVLNVACLANHNVNPLRVENAELPKQLTWIVLYYLRDLDSNLTPQSYREELIYLTRLTLNRLLEEKTQGGKKGSQRNIHLPS